MFSLEEEHKRLMKQLDIDNFSLSRIPRPGEIKEDKGTNSNIKKVAKVPKVDIEK